jgi:hypothetical protein
MEGGGEEKSNVCKPHLFVEAALQGAAPESKSGAHNAWRGRGRGKGREEKGEKKRGEGEERV